MFRVRVEPWVCAVLAGALSRAAMLRAHHALRQALARDLPQLQTDRDPANPDRFRVSLGVTDGDHLHGFTFLVNDRAAPGRLLVVEVEHKDLGPLP